MTESTTRTRVRTNDRQTSWDAASAQTEGKVAEVQAAVMDCLHRVASIYAPRYRTSNGLTDAQLCDRLGYSPSSVRTRRHELEMAGWVTPVLDGTGTVLKRQGQTVWRAVADDEEPPEPASRGRRGETKHERGLAAARRLGRWEWGADEYADKVLAAYLNPEAAHAALDADGAPA